MTDQRVETSIPCPPGYRYQLGKAAFNFEIITKSPNFIKYSDYARCHGLVRDICDDTLQPDNPTLPVDKYLNVVQKSDTWFTLRARADATASSVGKKIKGPTMYPTIEQVSQHWEDMLLSKPFETTHTMRGHMKWGVDYEDPALIHFAVENGLSVAQVGTIYVPLSYIIDLRESYDLPELTPYLGMGNYSIQSMADHGAHLLVSPDGLVGLPDEGEYSELPEQLVGMLEIKCISPFHHVENSDETLSWVDNMERRQWASPRGIPFVYIVQICMQAMSGLYRLNMTREHTMWFMRWSPIGFSEFKIAFEPLVRMGVVATVLYFQLKQRIQSLDDLPLEYTPVEWELYELLHREYINITNVMTHRYVAHETLYPEFSTYRKVTEHFHFVVD